MTDEPKYPFADQFKQDKNPGEFTSSVPRPRGRPKKEKPTPAPEDPRLAGFNDAFNAKRGRKKRKTSIDHMKKPYEQMPGVPALPLEDFYPGCICAIGQILPEEVDMEMIVNMAYIGLRADQIASLADMEVDTLMFHFKKTLAKVKARGVATKLGIVSEKAEEGDLSAIKMYMDRVDPPPKDGPQVMVMQPLPAHIIDMPSTERMALIKQIKNKGED